MAPHIQSDFDLEDDLLQELEVKDKEENQVGLVALPIAFVPWHVRWMMAYDLDLMQVKLQRRIRSVQVKVLNEPRPGKKCLVLDIDYTIFDL